MGPRTKANSCVKGRIVMRCVAFSFALLFPLCILARVSGSNGYGFEFNTPPLQYNPLEYYTYLTQLSASQGYNSPSAIVGFDPNRHI
jgi:hypothetical protein